MTRRLRVAAAATLLALLVSACGSDTPDDAGAAAGPFS
jgi:hypothetical protein